MSFLRANGNLIDTKWGLLEKFASLLAFVFLSCMVLPAQTNPPVRSFQLIAPGVGWASSEDAVFWTTDDGANWKNITPLNSHAEQKGPTIKIKDVFFLGEAKGWVLSSEWDEVTDAPQLNLASTENSGLSWAIAPISIPNFNSKMMTLSGNGDINFVDSAHGWLNLGLVSSPNFRLGLLLETTDGGKTWSQISNGPGISGRIYFNNSNDGWVAGGPGDQQLYVSHDGAKTWHEVSLKPPDEVGQAMAPSYGLPMFIGKSGFLSVTYSAGDQSDSKVVLFSTSDGGRTWSSKSAIPLSHGNSQGAKIPTAVVKFPSGEVSALPVEAIAGSKTLQIKFLDSTRGWASTWQGLVGTTDGGATWSDISPVKHHILN